MKIKNMLYAAMFAAIVAVLGLMPPIPLPFIPVPITLQTMGVMLAGSFLGKRLGFVSMLLVVVIVLLGVPILSGGRGGMAVLAGPTGGFFIVWPFAAFLIGFLVEKFWKNDKEIVKKSFWLNEKTGKYHFDNTKFNELMALKLGIKQENLIVADESTFDEKFHSYRREGKNAGRATAMISFK